MSTKRLLIDATHAEETRVIIADDNRIHEFDISATTKAQNKGNIYLAKVTRVEPSLQAAFVEYGGGRQGFLPFSEIHPDYYQIPVADRKKLIEEAAAEEQAEEDEEEEQENKSRRNDRNDRGGRGRRGRRRGGRGRPPQEQDEVGAVEDKGALSEDDIADTYLQEPIATDETQKSEVVDELIGKDNEAKSDLQNGDDNQQDITAPEGGNEKNAQNDEKPNNEKADSDNNDNDPDDDVENVTDGDADKTSVDSLDDDDEFTRRRKASFLRRYKIQEVIKRNQVILVQVIKEERGNKGASLSTYISLAGRYCVLMPNSPKTGGISRKISSSEDRKRLKAISEEIRSSNGMSAIIRTAGIDRTRAEIKRDYDYLLKLWNQIRELTISSTAPALVYEEANIVKRSLRDLYSSDIKEIIVAGEEAYKRSKEFMKLMMPSHAARVKQHTDNTPIFYAYDAEDQLLRMHEPNVKLESGGSIVLNPTEALVAIDVNSGRSTTERNVEETALKTNLEAAQEVARQVRLRDLAGLIVIDFIDMFDYKNRRAVERQLKESLKSDRAKIQLGRISAFGLLEMSRQRLRPSFAETNTHACAYCEGRGTVMTPDAQGIQLLRFVEKEASSGDYAHLKLKVQPAIALYLLNTKRERLTELEKTHNLQISIEMGEGLLSAASFILERYTADNQKTEVNGMDGIPSSGKRTRGGRKRKRPTKQSNDNANSSPNDDKDDNSDDKNESKKPAAKQDEDSEDRPRRRRRGGRRRGGRNRGDNNQNESNSNNEQPQQDTAAQAQPSDNTQTPDNAQQAKQESKPESQNDKPAAKRPARGRRKVNAPAQSDAGQPQADAKKPDDAAEEKPARKRPGRPKKVVAEGEETKPAAKAKPASKKDNSPAPAAKPIAAQQEKKELEPVGSAPQTNSSANDDDKKDGNRKGWWRRIVE